MYLYWLKRPITEANIPNGQRSLHQGRYIIKLAIATVIKEIPGIKNREASGLVKILKPVKGLIICSNEKLQKIANTTITPKKIHLIIVAVLSEISILYFTSFCFLMLDLKLIFEINSCNAPTGQAKPQIMRPNKKTVSNNIDNIIIMGSRLIMLLLSPIAERIV